jgi:hypothetical protein
LSGVNIDFRQLPTANFAAAILLSCRGTVDDTRDTLGRLGEELIDPRGDRAAAKTRPHRRPGRQRGAMVRAAAIPAPDRLPCRRERKVGGRM